MLLCGASYAHRVGAKGVAIGLLNPDAHLFPDQTENFLKCCETALKVALGREMSVVAPLLGLTKRDVLAMATQRGLK